MNQSLTAIDGLRVGHWTNTEAATGCTVVLCPAEGCVASGYALGSAPGSREYALLSPEKGVERVHAVLLTGGSAYGLDAAGGVMGWLESRQIGHETPFGVVPIVPASVIFDLPATRADVRPDAAAGSAAAAAASAAPVEQGRVGVGTGALVGKYLGFEHASFGGVGSALLEVGDAKVAALAVTNAVGDIVHADTAELLTGARVSADKRKQGYLLPLLSLAGMNTTLVVVATDAALTKAQAHALAQAAHMGIARVTRPSHTVHDGDTTYVLSTGRGPAVAMLALSIAVQEVVAEAIMNGVRAANG